MKIQIRAEMFCNRRYFQHPGPNLCQFVKEFEMDLGPLDPRLLTSLLKGEFIIKWPDDWDDGGGNVEGANPFQLNSNGSLTQSEGGGTLTFKINVRMKYMTKAYVDDLVAHGWVMQGDIFAGQYRHCFE